ncbi:MAG: FeoA family protein [Chloroflexota bacterium]|jgi:Fe2+ transport system protein FeoA
MALLPPIRLSEVPVGSTVMVTGVGVEGIERGRLLALGIIPGVSLSVVRTGHRSPVVVRLPGCHVAIDARSCEAIDVRHRPTSRGGDGSAA